MHRKNKNSNLCQVGTLCQSQGFMQWVIREFLYFVFMFINWFLYRNICTGPFISVDSESE